MSPGPLGTDIALDLIDKRALSIYRVRQAESRAVSSGRAVIQRDFGTLSDRDNLGQALIVRLLTPRGELEPLGHPLYGSRLHEIVGSTNTPTTRNLAKLFVIEAIKQERRIERIVSVEVKPHPVDRFQIEIAARVVPIGQDTVLDIGPLLIEL